ncbi:MAG: FKBP-type peptidyl-prolyl cis-trans isomerase [Paludibacteraceae bacterium]
MKITNNAVVNAEYELFVDGENGELELMEKATADQPLNFIYGVGMMLPKFEQNLKDLEVGESFDFTIDNEEAYGPYDDEAVIELERAVFEVDGKLDEEMVFEGNVVPLMDSEGNRLQAQVVSVSDSHVTVDLNHPLAGENLHFKGKVLEVREATEEELNALFGGGCGCGSAGCDCQDDEHDHDKAGGCGCGCGC